MRTGFFPYVQRKIIDCPLAAAGCLPVFCCIGRGARQGFKSRGHTRPQQNEGIPRGPSRANKGGKGKIPCRQYFTFALTIARGFLRLIPGPTFLIEVHPGFRRKNAGALTVEGNTRAAPVPSQQTTGNLFARDDIAEVFPK